MKKTVLAVALVLAAGAAQAQIKIEQPWTRATAPSAPNGAAFMTLVNPSSAPAERLIAAESSVARVVELHSHVMDGSVMRMRKVDGIDVKAGESVKLEPMGFHVMFLGLKAPLKEGDSVPLTLVFQNAGRIEIAATVAKAGAAGPGMDGAMGGHHQHMQHAPPKTN